MKRIWKKFAVIVFSLTLVLSLSGITALAVSYHEAAPSLTEFTGNMFQTSSYNGGVSIDCFTKDYINSLTAEEKQNMKVEIPAEYNGKPVTAIGQRAFSTFNPNFEYYKDVNFTALDLTRATNLQKINDMAFYSAKGADGFKGDLIIPSNVTYIGSNAFSGCAGFTGDLTLPDQLTVLDYSAFMNCSGLDGTLTLPTNPAFTELTMQVFYNTKFKNPLVIPDNITVIGKGAFRYNTNIVGELQLPAKLTTLGPASFGGCTGITGIKELPSTLTTIDSQAFCDCTNLTGVITIPDSVTLIGSQAFSHTKITTAYLPNNTATTFGSGNNAFYGCDQLTAIVCTPELFSQYQSKITPSTPKALLGYPTTVVFNDTGYSEEKLYNRPFNLVKNQETNSWYVDSNYNLKEFSEEAPLGYTRSWSFTQNALPTAKPLTKTSLVTNSNLYVFDAFSKPVITLTNDHLEKEYDGTTTNLTVNVSHPLKGSKVFFYYDWYRVKGYMGVDRKWTTDNVYPVTNVADSAYGGADWYHVNVYAYDKETKTNYFTSEDAYYCFNVNIKQGTPNVNPMFNSSFLYRDGFPTLTTSTGDTAGTIAWNEGQTLMPGVGDYQWTFVPQDTANYKTISHTETLDAINSMKIETITDGNGTITPGGDQMVTIGEDATYRIEANPGYRLSYVMVDGERVTLDEGDTYTFHNVEAPHKIEAFFEQLSTEDTNDQINQLPTISDDMTEEEKQQAVDNILDAKLNYEALGSDKDQISKEASKRLNDALAQLPGVAVDVPSTGGDRENHVTVPDPNMLLSTMTLEEALLIKENRITEYKVAAAIEESNPSQEEQSSIESALGSYQVGKQFDIKIQKHIVKDGVAETNDVTQLSQSVQLEFAIPQELAAPAPEGVKRVLKVLRCHENEDGTFTVELLDTTVDMETGMMLIETDQFSVYSIVYLDTYQVDFDSNSGSSTPTQWINHNELVNNPEEPTRKGYIFDGWYRDAELTTRWIFGEDKVTQATTLYAKWDKEDESFGGHDSSGNSEDQTSKPSDNTISDDTSSSNELVNQAGNNNNMDDNSPTTGDSSMVWYVVLGVIAVCSAAGLITIIYLQKKKVKSYKS